MISNRGLKNRTAISTSIDKELYAKLKEHSEETGIPLSKLFDKAIIAYFESIKRDQPPSFLHYQLCPSQQKISALAKMYDWCGSFRRLPFYFLCAPM